jgi:GTPase
VVSFIDLAGHERYLRTTVYGLTAHEPDYVMVVVGANHGITRMTKEHVGMAIALNVPLFVVVTKVDLCPEAVMKETMKQLTRLLKLPGARKQPYAVRGVEELMMAVRGFGKSAITPIFTISSVDGTNVPLLRQFFNLMPSRRSWVSTDQLPAEFLIDQFFNVVGVGLVVAGTLLSGLVTLNHQLLMGPDYQGRFNPVTVRSIHHMRTAVPALLPGQTGAFVVRSKTKEHVRQFGIRKGMVLLDPALNPVATKRFTCDVLVLHSQTTMRVNYQPILYARNVRQCVRIVEMDKDVLRTGVRARVTFEFMYRVEFLQKDTKVLFTEGKTKAIGTIRDLLGE